jgi:hypothetical protein
LAAAKPFRRVGVLEILDQLPSFRGLPSQICRNRLAGCARRYDPEQGLFDRSQHHNDNRGDNRERSTNARQAAEALFSPKRKPPPEQPAQEAARPDGEVVRKPRVLTISAPAPVDHQSAAHHESASPTKPKRQATPKIASSQFARIRAWVQYGMTAQQVAEMFGVTVGEIERIVSIA